MKDYRLESELDSIIADFEKYTNNKIICINLFSVDISEKNKFFVAYKGIDVVKYSNAIRAYFKVPGNLSFIYLDLNNSNDSIFLHDHLIDTELSTKIDIPNNKLELYQPEGKPFNKIIINQNNLKEEWSKWSNMVKSIYPYAKYIVLYIDEFKLPITDETVNEFEVTLRAACWFILAHPLDNITFTKYVFKSLLRFYLIETLLPHKYIHYSRLLKDAEWKTIVDEMSHSKRHEYGAMHKCVDEVQAGIDTMHDCLEDSLSEKIEEEFLSSKQFLNTTRKLINYNADSDKMLFALMKVGLNENDQERWVKDYLSSKRNLSMSEIIQDCIEVISQSLITIKLVEPDHQEKLIKCLEELKNRISDNLSFYRVHTIPNAFRILVMDLLKNSCKFTKSTNPHIDIFLTSRETEYLLHFTNNQTIDEEGYRYIKFNEEAKSWSKTAKIGWRVIRRILDFNGLGSSGIKWRHDIDDLSTKTDRTDIYIIIPKTDIDYEKNNNS